MQNELPKRKSPRWCGFDYSNAGAYFLTVCTEKRAKTLSKIVGEGFPLPLLPQKTAFHRGFFILRLTNPLLLGYNTLATQFNNLSTRPYYAK